MSREQEIIVPISADASGLVKGVNEAKNSLGTLKSAASNASEEIDKILTKKTGLTGSDVMRLKELGYDFNTVAKEANNAGQQIESAMKAPKEEIDHLGDSAKKASESVEGFGNSAQKSRGSVNELFTSLQRAAVAYISIEAAIKGVSAVLQAGMGFDKLNSMMLISAGSSGAVAGQIDYLKNLSNKLGLEFQSTAEAFGKFNAAAKGSALEGAQTRQVFEGFATASKALNLTTAESEGVFLALSQMMAKGKVTAEEFRGQLGERLPMALQAGASALGVTTQKFSEMLDKGELTVDLLPKMADKLKDLTAAAAEQGSGGLAAEWNKLGNAWQEFLVKISQSGAMDSAVNALKVLGDEIKRMKDNGELDKWAQEISNSISGLVNVFGGLIFVLKENAGLIKFLVEAFVGFKILTSIVPVFTKLAEVAGFVARAFGILRTAIAFLGGPVSIAIGAAIGLYTWFSKNKEAAEEQAKAVQKAAQVQKAFNDEIKRLDNAGLKEAARNMEAFKEAAAKNPAKADEMLNEVRRMTSDIITEKTKIDTYNKRLADLTLQREKILAGDIVQTEKEKIDKQIEETKKLLEERKKALDEALEAEKKYTQAAIEEHEKAKQSRIDTADKIRDMRRKSMSEEEAEADKTAEASEKITASQIKNQEAIKLAAEGNLEASKKASDAAIDLAKDAESLGSSLKNTETGIAIVQQAGDAIVNAHESAAKANENAAEKAKSNIEELKSGVQDLTNQISELEKKSILIPIELDIKNTEKSIEATKKQLQEQLDGIQDYAKQKGISLGVKVDEEGKAKEAIDKLKEPTESSHTVQPNTSEADAKIDNLKQPTSSTHTVYVNTVGGGGSSGGSSSDSGGELPAFATGGYVSGPGTTTSDSIVALLSDKEYVINAERTQKIGRRMLDWLNFGDLSKMPRFATGGYVQKVSSSPIGSSSAPMSNVNVHLDGGVFPMQTEKHIADSLLDKIEKSKLKFGSKR